MLQVGVKQLRDYLRTEDFLQSLDSETAALRPGNKISGAVPPSPPPVCGSVTASGAAGSTPATHVSPLHAAALNA